MTSNQLESDFVKWKIVFSAGNSVKSISRNWFHGKNKWKSTFFRTNSSRVLLMLLVFFVFQNIYNRLYGDLPIWFTEFQIEIVESERHHKSWFLFFSFWPKDAMQQSRTTTQNYYTYYSQIHKFESTFAINIRIH